ncbi:DUF2281 domain-containing protein [Anabaena cylindrica FACHB-243]|uniref:DUF2281 domain-containing protein n=1 Tax=Anabaena cylindrica (strain ATCC 27899 / PCC 7122) TaxID=272123 RepID=K9ZH92_ANACC|nr:MULTISPECIES: DUF2281 domain-containing protein [Anabaena]AFZ57700.1 hypothetical protein Anacy_2240 [Anabaena cylindrica PCC 7122]MBD2419387.1 DUF2281 domain-containing protein [Anabaena cylindrica FACHB-243]MBY5280609.1 DUF2281 domain-containing protein [Anabaena sp. CCAP 1446/1C]MBY5307851.1 DUF2281 domain-containing protein [Anabaena sp. CCAP 1446/1C]MCM2407577.1 DUF2281 domain-containing protein [Anabaena sp. CCAP 1446/1C]
MNLQEKTIAQIQQMPPSLFQEVSDFIDFLFIKHSSNKGILNDFPELTEEDIKACEELWLQFSESLDIAESDFSDYLSNLGDYEKCLARGDIQW